MKANNIQYFTIILATGVVFGAPSTIEETKRKLTNNENLLCADKINGYYSFGNFKVLCKENQVCQVFYCYEDNIQAFSGIKKKNRENDDCEFVGSGIACQPSRRKRRQIKFNYAPVPFNSLKNQVPFNANFGDDDVNSLPLWFEDK